LKNILEDEMKVICCVCQKEWVKDTGNPKDNDLISHSYCESCFEKEREKFRKEKERSNEVNQK